MTGQRVAVVTGAGRGIGAAVVRRLSVDGWPVIAGARLLGAARRWGVHRMTQLRSLAVGPGQPPSGAAWAMLPRPPDTRLPAGFAVQLAADVHRSRNGRLMLGGSPPRLLRLTPAAAQLLQPGHFTVTDRASGVLARRLVDSGVVNPRPPACPV